MGRGDYLARLGPERHEKLAKAASANGVSMNQLLCDAVDLLLEGEGMSRSEARKAVFAELAAILPQLGSGYVLVPAAESLPDGPPDTWDGFMGGERT